MASRTNTWEPGRSELIAGACCHTIVCGLTRTTRPSWNVMVWASGSVRAIVPVTFTGDGAGTETTVAGGAGATWVCEGIWVCWVTVVTVVVVVPGGIITMVAPGLSPSSKAGWPLFMIVAPGLSWTMRPSPRYTVRVPGST